jgi:protein-tyrosine kinase
MGKSTIMTVPGASDVIVEKDRILPAEEHAVKRTGGERLIGALLLDAGRLAPEDAERILHLQRESGLRFGEAGLRLGLLTPADIDFAVSRQFDARYVRHGESRVSAKLLVAYAASGPQVEALRALRTQLMLRWFDGDPARKALGIVSATRNEGRSLIAASLAVLFSQLGEQTLLIDADMRNPGQHELFGLDNRVGLSALLSERAGHEAIQRIPSLPELAVLTAGASPPNPLELLARPLFPQLLSDVAQKFDVILLDSTSMAECVDAQTVAVRAGAALVVARKNVTHIREVRGVIDAMNKVGVTVLGSVLNDF